MSSIHDRNRVRTLRRTGVISLGLAGFVLLGFRVAACDLPPLVAIPDAKDVGDKRQEIFEDAQRYHRAVTAYAECVLQETPSAQRCGLNAARAQRCTGRQPGVSCRDAPIQM